MQSFKRGHTESARREAVARMLLRHPDRVPAIVEVAPGSKMTLARAKYLIPGEITVGKFIMELRKSLSLAPEQAIFLYVGGGRLPPTAAPMAQVYTKYKDSDDFLYIVIANENTFG